MPRPMLALAIVICFAAPARAQCEVEGIASIPRVRVRVPGERMRTMAARDMAVAVRPGDGNRYRTVRVLAPIAFEARTDADIPWAVPRPGSVMGGMLWLTPEVDVEEVREVEHREDEDEDEDDAEDREAAPVRPGRLRLRVQLDTGVWVSRVEVSCRAITLGPRDEEAPTPDWAVARGPRWVPSSDHVWIVADPDDEETPAMRLDAPGGLPVPLTELERRGEHVRVAIVFSSGAAIRGWVRAHHLRAQASVPPTGAPFRRPPTPVEVPQCRRAGPARGEYVGPARLTAGATVYTARGGTSWASATASGPEAGARSSVVTVSWRPGDEWAQIVHVPGLLEGGECPEVLRRAWIRRADVHLEGGRRR